MKIALIRLIVPALILVGLQVSTASAQSTTPIEVPPVPANLEVPAGHTLFLATRAVGTQNYVCVSGAKRAVGWRFIGPQATLFVDSGDGFEQQATTHFLSVNPIEALARPTWQHSIDTSRVWGRVRSSSTDPNYVAPGAIPWLLLEMAGTELGPTGGGFMAQTTFIHRVNTGGGVAPSTGCTNDDHIGTIALVPYTTDYFFYRAIQN
jgi:uncharacterized protein DUF3455